VFRFLTAGESHGPALTALIEGVPAGLPITAEPINIQLKRRQGGYGRGARQKIESDTAEILSGIRFGLTMGGPITLVVRNRDWANWGVKMSVEPLPSGENPPPEITVPRPGHADLTGALKYGYRDLRLALERASARETTMRVAVSAVCKRFLQEFGITVQGYVTAIGEVSVALPVLHDPQDYLARFEATEASDVRCPDPVTAERMHEAVRATMQAKDTLGGIIEVAAIGLPPGLGSHVHYDRKLDGRLMGAVGSIQSIKGVEIGQAFAQAQQRGTQVHDEIALHDGRLMRRSNRAGGLEGGITTGEPLIVRAAMKPISTTLNPIDSVDLATGAASPTTYERSDFCAVPRAVVVIEAMVAIVLADALLEKLGGDSMDEMRPRFAALRQNRPADVPMDNVPWRFNYEWT